MVSKFAQVNDPSIPNLIYVSNGDEFSLSFSLYPSNSLKIGTMYLGKIKTEAVMNPAHQIKITYWQFLNS